MTTTAYKATILAVDDTPENLDVVKGILSEDYIVKAATSGAMALKIIDKQAPDLILLDIMMPDMDGYEVCRRLKANAVTASIPVIFLTAMEQTTDEAQGFALGAADYITKPVNPPILKARVGTHIALKRSMDELQTAYAIIKKHSERMEEELSVGHDIQMSMIPLDFPRFPEHKDLDVWAHIRPAREVGGDFYDFFMVDDRYFAFVIADVSGKGVPAALLMAVAKTLLKARSQDTKSSSNVILAINKELSENNDDCMFITAFFGIVDTKSGVLTYTNAGHNPPYLIKTDATVKKLGEIHGPMVGVMPGASYGEAQLELDVDDKLLLYTDGVTEAFNSNGGAYGEDRLEAFIERSTKLGTKYLVESLMQDVDGFADGEEQSDDITVFCLRYVAWEVRDARGTVELRLTNDLAEIDRCLSALEEICERFKLPPEIQNNFSVVLDDLLNNVISYAYDDDAKHIIDVVLSTDGQRFIVSVTDGGVEFDPFARKEPDIESGLEEREVGGLGIHLIRNLMDDYSYRRVGDKNVTTLMKRFKGEVPGQQNETTKN